ncbi:hypothetical protein HTZ84_22530 [Haloterrigena sp. SYSU A558-1]|uniref:Uncharacterized protein n=1 Tax=Haloterrigena gelatinilytica TaxID=2741724 RepID=A0ABX2LKE0_9EURY|nr:hypothetical protein [Haloterrigena gelatinilytica]NUC75045.1 hypothetical protein [Haloterrigena gelatinilytica]
MTEILAEPDQTAARIREYARENPDLRKNRYDGREGTVDGLCYPAAEAYYHAKDGRETDLRIYCLSWSDVNPDASGTHWYLRDGETGPWIDLGLEDAADAAGIPYAEGRHRSFMTGYDRPSKRTQRILEDLGLAEDTA